jgi:hypothetical protein
MDGGRSKKDSSSREQPRNGGDKTQEGDIKWRDGGGEEEENMQCDECTGGMHQNAMDGGWMNGGERREDFPPPTAAFCCEEIRF